MEKDKVKSPFVYKVIMVENRPRIYAVPTSEEEKYPSGRPQVPKEEDGKRLFSFFGHRLENLLVSAKPQEEDLPPVEKELEKSPEEVQKKFEEAQVGRKAEINVLEKERMKHEGLIEERNRSQVLLFKDIVETHSKMGTGLKEEDVLSLHRFMKNAAHHERDCFSHEILHKHIECNAMSFFRRKAVEKGWQRIENYLERSGIPFPVPTSMLDREDEVRNEEVREEGKKAAGEDFRKMTPQQCAEMILGNVPVWVYSYPEKDSYLWLLTVLQGVATGIAAKLYLNYLGFWEKNSSLLLQKIDRRYTEKIRATREREGLPDPLRLSARSIIVRLRTMVTAALDRQEERHCRPFCRLWIESFAGAPRGLARLSRSLRRSITRSWSWRGSLCDRCSPTP